MRFENMSCIWKDKKHILGIPMSFTHYALTEDRLLLSVGFLNIKDDELLLYRVRDINTTRSLFQRIVGVGTVTVSSSDKSTPALELKNIKNPLEVKELLHKQVEETKIRRGVRFNEVNAEFFDTDESEIN